MNRCVLRVLSAVVSLVLLSSCGTYERLQEELELAQRTNQQLIDQYSIQLGLERATNVFKYLNLKHGIPEERVAIFSSGSGKPPSAEKAGSLQGTGKNRRVVFRLSAHSY